MIIVVRLMKFVRVLVSVELVMLSCGVGLRFRISMGLSVMFRIVVRIIV